MDKKKVFKMLKTKAASFGFSREELMNVAATIADKLDSDDASDEDIDAEIDAVLPYLKVGQQQAQRVIKANKPAPTTSGDEEDDEDDDTTPATPPKNKKTKGNDDAPEWVQGLLKTVETLSKEVISLKGDKVTTTRKAKLEALLKDSGDFGKRELKRFSRMNFDSEEAFEEYISEVEEDLEDHKQDEGDEVLATVTKPVGGSGKKGKPEIATDAEIDSLVANL